MAKISVLKRLNNFVLKVTGNALNLYDIILICSVAPYVYMVLKGIAFPESGIWAVYFEIFAPALTYATITKWVVQFLLKKAKKW